jgi:transposase InsO family protein
LRRPHDPPIERHFDYKVMFHAMSNNYFWSQMRDDCRRYAVNCFTCRRSKAYNTQKQELLASLLISQRKWLNLSLNFVEFLFDCTRRGRTYRHILVIVDRLIKRRLYEPMMSLFTDELMNVMQRRMFFAYGLSATMISDRGTQLVAELWRRICKRYEISIKSSSAHHPETDGQTENVNKVMKNHLRAYVTYAQDDWVDYLPDAEFAVNNHMNVFIDMISFFADHEYHPRTEAEPSESYERNRKMEVRKADEIVQRQELMIQWIKENLIWAQAEQSHHANKGRQPHPEYKVEDLVYVNAKDFSFERSSRSLTFKNVSPWKITRVIDNKAYELKLSDHLKAAELTPIFHSWKLHLTPTDPFSGQVNPPEPSVIITDSQTKESHEEYEILDIVDCRRTAKRGLQYKATYIDNWDQWNADSSWQSASDFENARNQINRFHRTNSIKSQSEV